MAENDTMIQQLLGKLRGQTRKLSENEMDIYLDVIAHPTFMPTREELGYFNRDKSDEEIDEAVSTLMSGGLIWVVGGEDTDGQYVSFYGLTQYGAEKASGACSDIGGMRRDFSNVDWPERAQELMELPRPPTTEVEGVQVPDRSGLPN